MMTGEERHQPSQLFTVRMWEEALGGDRQEVRGTVQHVVTGEARHFRDWTTLHSFLLEKLETPEKQPDLASDTREAGNGDAADIDDRERTHRP